MIDNILKIYKPDKIKKPVTLNERNSNPRCLFTKEQIETGLKLMNKGLSAGKAAKIVGCSKQTMLLEYRKLKE